MVSRWALRSDWARTSLRKLNWSLMNRRKDKALMHVREWSIEVFPLVNRAVIIIFTVHHMEIILESRLYLFDNITFRSIWINWLSSFPVVLIPLLEKLVIPNSIAWHFVNVLHLIGVLVGTASLIEKLFVLRVVELVVLRVGYIGSVVPRRNLAWPWHINAKSFNRYISYFLTI